MRARTREKGATLSNTRLFLAVSLACMLSGASVQAADTDAADAAQAQPGVLLDTVRANRKALVAVNLELSPEQAEKFWPLYDNYQREIDAIGDRVLAIVEDYTASFRDLADDRLEVRRAYLGKFAKILPGRTVARFYQIENKIDAILRYDLAATIPVVEEKHDSPAK
jgi:hypothetical protein